MSGVAAKRVVLLDDPYNQPEEPWMEFRLTYRGPLLATQQGPPPGQPDRRAGHKHEIRKVFHKQLKRLWAITPFLKTGERSGPEVILLESSPDSPDYRAPVLAAKHAHFNFNFVPLVTAEMKLLCGLDILFLRPDIPGHVIWAGDIDNRLKTLFDALKIPSAEEHYHERVPDAEEKPFFCLLEDDKLITKVSVETDQLLDFAGGDQAEAALVITVRLRPYDMGLHNMQFG